MIAIKGGNNQITSRELGQYNQITSKSPISTTREERLRSRNNQYNIPGGM